MESWPELLHTSTNVSLQGLGLVSSGRLDQMTLSSRVIRRFWAATTYYLVGTTYYLVGTTYVLPNRYYLLSTTCHLRFGSKT